MPINTTNFQGNNIIQSGTAAMEPVYFPAAHPNPHVKMGRWFTPFVLMLLDYGLVFLALKSSLLLRDVVWPREVLSLPEIPLNEHVFYWTMPLFYIGFLIYEGLYTKRLPFWQSTQKLIKVGTYAAAFIIGAMYFAGATKTVSRLFVFATWLFSCFYLIVGRNIVKRVLECVGLWRCPVIIVGAGKTTELLAKAFEEEPGLGYEIVGVIDEGHKYNAANTNYPIIANFSFLEQAITSSGVSEVVIAMPELGRERLLELVYRIQPLVRKLNIVPDLLGLPLSNLETATFFNQKAMMLRVGNNLVSWKNRFVKRLFDLCLGTLFLVLGFPIMLIVAILIRMDSPGPILLRDRRIGKRGVEFPCYKFRTMYLNSDAILQKHLDENEEARREWERFAKLRVYDPRVTRTGQWIRKWSLDELPQIFNVLKGDMSLVGPRPYLPRERDKMSYYIDTILETTPGITGLWQVGGRNEIDFNGRMSLDAWYVRNWGIWLDIVLLAKTVGVVVRRKGAY
ncbi:MAG TPA: undecaprenyl-phosphate galactose phosphotransferase WbaP [Bacillota bacterium]|nr:undecaprenyl-phosphate galactose phosphotransferase WbaP [Bacillota bacterium]